MKEIKQFFNDCMLFKHPDIQIRLIGVVIWIDVVGWIYLFYRVFF